MHKGKSQFGVSSPTVCYCARTLARRDEAKRGRNAIIFPLPFSLQHQYYVGNITLSLAGTVPEV